MNSAVHQRTTLNELVSMINKILGKDIEPIHTEPRAGDIKHSFADISRLKENLGYQPSVLLEEGLKRTIAWYQQQYVSENVLVS